MSFPVFDDRTKFVSVWLISYAALGVSALSVIPLIYRLAELARHEKTGSTLCGQLSALLAFTIPSIYIGCYKPGGLHTAFAMAVAYLAALLHYVQDGRVNVCCPDLLLFWTGKIVVHMSWAIASYPAWTPICLAVMSVAILMLELFNPARRAEDCMDDKSIFDLITSDFTHKVLKAGATGPIYTDAFTLPPKTLNAASCTNNFEACLQRSNGKFRVWRAILGSTRWKLLAIIITQYLQQFIKLLEPRCLQLFLGALSDYVDGKAPLYPSYYYALLCGGLPMVGACSGNLSEMMDSFTQASAKVSLFSAIYRKGLRLSPASRARYPTSKIMVLINSDSEHLFSFLDVIPSLASIPFNVIFSWFQLYSFLGPTFLAAIAVYALIIPVTGSISFKVSSLFEEKMELYDTRLEHTSNTFRNMKTIKLNAWESPFAEKILYVRNFEELPLFKHIMYFISVMDEAWETVGSLVSIAVFTAYLYFGQGTLSPEIVFPSLILLDIATEPFMELPFIVETLGQAITSQKRVHAYLSEEDHSYANYERSDGAGNVTVAGAVVGWTGEPDTQVLDDVTLSARSGDLVCIVGEVGCGKTAFLKALGGELVIKKGSITIEGSVAYCSQEAWLQNLTLRENIVFGQKFDKEWYDRVVEACELVTDIKELPMGDATNLGTRGVALSGGQKARAALARAVYARANIYLLDDVLSAVDEHVGGALIKQLFAADGLLAGSTLIMATHNTKVLAHASQVIRLENQKFVECTMSERSVTSPNLGQSLPLLLPNTRHYTDDEEEQDSEDGSGLWLYRRYFQYLHPVYLLSLVCLVIFSVLVNNFIVIYMGWVSNMALSNFAEGWPYLAIYMSLILAGSTSNLVANLWLYIVTAIKISRRVHDDMLDSVMHAPMSFFEANPLGKIVNRFTHDIEILDDEIPYTVMLCLHTFLQLLVSMLTVIVGTPIATLIIVPLGFIGNNIRRLFVPTERKVTRICSAASSPILSQIEDSMNGQTTIRMFARCDQFVELYEQRADYWIKATVFEGSVGRWFTFRMEAITAVISLTCSLSVTRLVGSGRVSVGFAGLINSLALKSGVMIGDSIRYLSRAESKAVALKRILDYINLCQEAPFYRQSEVVDWPRSGAVEIRDLRVRYSPAGADVLKGVSMSIQAGEKIGIVGRTGSGKSTFSLSIFRILEASAGTITIDGIDISMLGLHELRSKLSIIPQDAQILTGTIRENLDPLNTADDARLWEVLENCHLRAVFEARGENLDSELTTLSLGQSQLLCLGRALVHESPVLVMDEATASVDTNTDEKVQETIRTHFKTRTVITIAHRLNTILDSDRVIVFDNGEVVEFNTPKNLLSDKNSAFSRMYCVN